MPQYTSKSPLLTHVVVDVMSTVLQYRGFSGGKTFGEAIQSIFNTTSHIAEHDTIHLLFDSYTDLSIKCSERNHRKGEIDSIDLASVQEDAPIPTLIEKFWPSASNKENLQLLRQVALTKFDNVVLSSMFIDDELVNSFHQAPISTSVNELDSWEEEADKVISHAMWAINCGAKQLIGLSNDCDTLMLLLWYMERFIENGLKEFWLQYGRGERKRMTPVQCIRDGMVQDIAQNPQSNWK